MIGVGAWVCMDADYSKLRLSPLEDTLLRITVVLYRRGARIDRGVYACGPVLVGEARSAGQTWEGAVDQLLVTGLIEERFTGSFQPTRLGIDQWRQARFRFVRP